MKLTLTLAAAVVAAALPMASAQAGRPLITDDAGVLAPGDCELEGAALQQRSAGERSTETGLQIACGLRRVGQVSLALATDTRLGERSTGLALGGKTALWQAGGADDAHGRTAVTLAWQVLGARAPGGAWRHVGTGLTLIGSRPLGAGLTLHANLGHARDSVARQGSTAWGLGLEHDGLDDAGHWAPTAELFGDDREAPWWSLGLRATALPDRLFVALSYGRQITGGQPALLTLSVKAAF